MAKQKVTITLDRAKAGEARRLVESANTSEVIDVADDIDWEGLYADEAR